MARMKQLATNRGDAKRRSKKDRSSLKSTFRDLCSTLEVRAPSHAYQAAALLQDTLTRKEQCFTRRTEPSKPAPHLGLCTRTW